MFIGIVGGIDRQAGKLIELGEAAGHDVRCHNGHVQGGASVGELRTLVERSDRIVIVTDVNSHNAVKLARRMARSAQRPATMVRRLGASQFATMLKGWNAGERGQGSMDGVVGRG